MTWWQRSRRTSTHSGVIDSKWRLKSRQLESRSPMGLPSPRLGSLRTCYGPCARHRKVDSRCRCRCDIQLCNGSWINAASVMNRYVVGNDGLTAHKRLYGRRANSKAVEFGVKVFYHVPKKLKSKMQLRWKIGIYLVSRDIQGNTASAHRARW